MDSSRTYSKRLKQARETFKSQIFAFKIVHIFDADDEDDLLKQNNSFVKSLRLRFPLKRVTQQQPSSNSGDRVFTRATMMQRMIASVLSSLASRKTCGFVDTVMIVCERDFKIELLRSSFKT